MDKLSHCEYMLSVQALLYSVAFPAFGLNLARDRLDRVGCYGKRVSVKTVPRALPRAFIAFSEECYPAFVTRTMSGHRPDKVY